MLHYYTETVLNFRLIICSLLRQEMNSKIFRLMFFAIHTAYGLNPPMRKFGYDHINLDIGWVGLKRYENHTLAYTPFKAVNVTTPVECAEECILAKESDCTSFNLKRDAGYDNGTALLECSLTDTSRYYFPKLFGPSNGTDFYEIYVSKRYCLYKKLIILVKARVGSF